MVSRRDTTLIVASNYLGTLDPKDLIGYDDCGDIHEDGVWEAVSDYCYGFCTKKINELLESARIEFE